MSCCFQIWYEAWPWHNTKAREYEWIDLFPFVHRGAYGSSHDADSSSSPWTTVLDDGRQVELLSADQVLCLCRAPAAEETGTVVGLAMVVCEGMQALTIVC